MAGRDVAGLDRPVLELRETIGLDYLMCAPLSQQSFTLFTERGLPKLV